MAIPSRPSRPDLAVRVAATAYTQSTTGGRNVERLVGMADGDPRVLEDAVGRLGEVALGDTVHLDGARELLIRAAERARVAASAPAPGQALDDPERLEALELSGLLDSAIEEAFDRATRLASRVVGTPVALVSIVDRDRQFFKSQVGLPEPWASDRETPLTHSFCQYVVSSGDALAVEDARRHPLVADNLAIRDLNVIAYLGVPLEDEDGQVLGSFCAISDEPRAWTPEDREALVDIAGLVRREIRLRRIATHLDARLREIQTAVSMLAHDVRSPLSAIQQSLVTAERLLDSRQVVEAVLEIATRHLQRLEGLTQALLEVRSPTELDREVLAVRAVVDELVSQRLLPEDAVERLRNQVPGDLEVLVPPTALEQVLLNLIGNALRHTRGPVTVSAVDEGAQVVVEVRDRGPGIQGDLDELVRPHRRGDTTASGYGLGLAVVRYFVQQMGAGLELNEDDGATFRVVLPAADRARS